jgi:hypothetical protein
MGLNREEILGKRGGRVEEIKVPEWGGTVFVREITASERDAFEASSLDKKGGAKMVNIRARLAVLTLSDSEGKRLFGDADVAALGELPASAMDRIFEAAMRVNRLTKSDVDELEKNSEDQAEAPAA